MPQKFLVIQTAFIGDAVLATGILEKLHHWFPDASIDYLVRKGNESLFSDHPFIRKLLVWDKQTNKKKNLFRLLLSIRKENYDKVINVQRYAATGLLTALSGATERIGFDKNPLSFLFTTKVLHSFGQGDESKHEIERNNRLIQQFTDDQAFKPRLYPREQDHAAVYKYRRLPYICVAPSSVWFTKQYPKEKWIDLINQVPYDFSVYLLGGPDDAEYVDFIKIRTANPYVRNLCGELSMLESVSMLEGSAMNYVNDSAPMHMSSAVNAPTTAVYCSTVPAFGYGPLSDERYIVQYEEKLYCRPCGLHGHAACPEKHFRCANEIHVNQLLASLPKAPALKMS